MLIIIVITRKVVILKVTRNTTQRMLILRYLKSVVDHPTAENVYRHVKKELPAMTLATVYRNLNLLSENRQIVKVKINNEYRFDAHDTKHQHCVCTKCEKMLDCSVKELSEIEINKFKSQFFTPYSMTVIVNGICDDCQSKKQKILRG